MALAYYKILESSEDFVRKILELQNRIEPETRAENAAATKIQAVWCRHKTWRLIEYWQEAARTIHRFWKGFLARRHVRLLRARNEEKRLLAAINRSATLIQAAWRGYLSRKKILAFYERKRKLQAICAINLKVQEDMRKHHEESRKDSVGQLLSDFLAQAERTLEKLHCTVSTKAQPGVFARNQPVEQAIIEQTRRALHSNPKTLESLRPPREVFTPRSAKKVY